MVPRPLRAILMSLAVVGLAYPAAADPPDRVARISYISGSVSFRTASTDEWTAATRNYPLTVGDHLWTDRGGRAELELGATFVRLATSTEFSVLDLDDQIAQLRITQGTATLRVRELSNEGIEIDTPNGAVTIDQPGFYRIDVDDSGGRTIVTARSGRAEVTAGDASYVVEARQSVVLGDGPSPYTLQAVRDADDFEDWSLARDRRLETSASLRYVSPRMIGYEDLDEYGVWRDEPGYGQAWYPRVSVEWVPYRFGHWAWIDPWGWTWIGDEPWGFAPFHYGRWLRARGGWAWIPGGAAVRPVYAPALVAFVGGSGWQASFSFGSSPVGWFPLGPREPFVPAYGASFAYLRAVNAPHIEWRGNVEVSRVRYVNREVLGATTAVPRDAFVRARPVSSAALPVPRDAFRNATPTQEAPGRPARPELARVGVPGSAPPAAAIDRTVVVRRTPPDAARARFRNAPQVVAQPRQAPVQGARPGEFGQPAQRRGPERPPQQQVAPPSVAPERVVPPPVPQREERRAAPPARPQSEAVAPPQPERVVPQERPRQRAPQERVEPPPVAAQPRPQPERVAPPQPERVIPQERPRQRAPQERVEPPPVAAQPRPQPERVLPPQPERVVPQERPRQRAPQERVEPPPVAPQPPPQPERAAPPRPERAAPPERPRQQAAPQERAAPPPAAAQPRPQPERAAPAERPKQERAAPQDNSRGGGRDRSKSDEGGKSEGRKKDK